VDLKYSSPPIRNLHICAIHRVAAASQGQYVRCVSAAQYVKTTLIVALDSERRTNSIIEKIDFFQNDNRFLEKNEINIHSSTYLTNIQLLANETKQNSIINKKNTT